MVMAGDRPDQAAPITGDGSPRLYLVVQGGCAEEKRIPLRRAVTLLGSSRGCKIRLQHPHVSPVHTALVNDGSRILAVDLVSRHGTLLNGLKMGQDSLESGDLLTILAWEFRVEIEQPNQDGEGNIHPFRRESAPLAVSLEHKTTGRVLRPRRDLCVLGRRAGCDIVLSDKRVSRVHALLFNQFGHPAILDLLSSNGTRVNDNPVSFHLLHEDDVMTLGESSLAVHLASPSATDEACDDVQALDSDSDIELPDLVPDLIDIEKTEASQPWRIAEKVDPSPRIARNA